MTRAADPKPEDRNSGTSTGRDADSPLEMPARGWKQVALRTWRQANEDNLGLVAAGVAFYTFLALVPLLGATVLTYGLVAAPDTVLRNVQSLATVLPADAAKLIGEQLMNVVETSSGKKGFGLALALGIALFGARNAAGAIITALNIAYEEEESRGFLKVTLLALAITVAAVGLAVAAMLAMTMLGYLATFAPSAPPALVLLGKLGSYLALALGAAVAAAALYRYGPDRDRARWRWITPGSLFAALAWIALTLGFGFYVANFGNYGRTYGSLATVVVLVTWIYLSAYVFLFGAELNSELEHQTARDTTEGAERPLGERGAWSADHVAASAEPEKPSEGEEGAPDAPVPVSPRAEQPVPAPSRQRALPGTFYFLLGGGAAAWLMTRLGRR